MASDHSFDIVSKVDMAEVQNALNQASGEIRQRYDFKGSKSEITLDEKAGTITLISDDNLKMKSVVDILQSKLIKRNVSIKNLEYGKVEPAAGDTVRQLVTLQQGIPQDKAKTLIKLIKDSNLKVQASIQKDQVRVVGKKKDDLQAVMNLAREKDLGIGLQYVNYR